jgi:uncharacterized protein YjbI with pentapeptide repeats
VSRARPPAVPDALDAPALATAHVAELDDETALDGVALGGSAPAELRARFVTVTAGLVTASIAGARLPDATFRGCVLDGADLANAHAEGASLQRTLARDTRLTGATLTRASLQDVTLTDCRAGFASFAAARMERVVLADCDLRETSFDEARLRDVRFERCRLEEASFHRAVLQRVELVGCELAGVRSVSDLRGAAMPWADIVANAGPLAVAVGIELLEEEAGGPE